MRAGVAVSARTIGRFQEVKEANTAFLELVLSDFRTIFKKKRFMPDSSKFLKV
jgi:hypothetical protein